MIAPPKATAAPTISRVKLNEWSDGYSSNLDDNRTSDKGLRAATNVVLDQDGVIRPRPSLVEYGPQPTGTILGQIGEFKEVNETSTTIWMITVQNVSGTAKVYIRKDTDDWIECNGKTFDTTAECYFSQIDDKVLITNGVDNLSYLEVDTKNIIPFTQLTTPSGLAGVVGGGLTGTTYTLKAQVTASNRGETAGSAIATVTVSKIRDTWTAATEIVTWTWNRVTNADRYHLYVADTAGGTPEYLTTVVDPGSGSTVSFVDAGTIALDFTRIAPDGDSTAGPKAKRSEIINGRVYLTGVPTRPRDVIYGGVGDNVLDFSPFAGGGSTEIGNGGKEIPVRVKSFRSGQGQPNITVLCQSTGGKGKRYTMSPETLTIGETVVDYFAVNEDNGETGTDAPDSVISYKDALWYFSLDNFKTTFTKAQIQSILSTEGVGDKIQPDVRNINLANIDKCVGYAFQDKLYWALPVGSTSNNQIWVLDLKIGKGWMLPWEIDADFLGSYQDNSGNTHFICLQNNTIYEFSYSQLTTDGSTAFSTYARSGIVKFSDDGMEWAKVIDVTFVLLRPKGTINLTFSGFTEDNETSQSVGTDSYSGSSSYAGWGEAGWGMLGFGETLEVPESSGLTRVAVPIEIDEELNWFYWEISSSVPGTEYALSNVIVRYVGIGTKDLT